MRGIATRSCTIFRQAPQRQRQTYDASDPDALAVFAQDLGELRILDAVIWQWPLRGYALLAGRGRSSAVANLWRRQHGADGQQILDHILAIRSSLHLVGGSLPRSLALRFGCSGLIWHSQRAGASRPLRRLPASFDKAAHHRTIYSRSSSELRRCVWCGVLQI